MYHCRALLLYLSIWFNFVTGPDSEIVLGYLYLEVYSPKKEALDRDLMDKKNKVCIQNTSTTI